MGTCCGGHVVPLALFLYKTKNKEVATDPVFGGAPTPKLTPINHHHPKIRRIYPTRRKDITLPTTKMSQTMNDTYPLLPASQDDSPIVPPVVVAVPVAKSRGRPKKPATEEEKAAAEAAKAAKDAEKAKKEAEKKAKEEEKAAAKAAKEAEKAEKDANKKPRGRPKKESPTLSPTVPAHNPADIEVITHLQEDVASEASVIVALRAEIAALKEENKRFSEIISSVCALVSL